MKERIIISVGKDWDGFTFRIPPKTKQYLKVAGLQTKGMTKSKKPEPLMDQVSISFDEKKKIEEVGGPVYKYVIEMLTGMSYEKIQKLGGAIFLDPVTEEIFYDTKKKGGKD